MSYIKPLLLKYCHFTSNISTRLFPLSLSSNNSTTMTQNSIFSSIQDTLQSFIGLLPASTSSHNLLRNDPYQPGDDEIFDVNIWEEDKARNITYEVDDHHKIKSASFNQLVIFLIEENDHLQNNDLDVFLTTYQSFTTSNVLLKKLIQRYNVPNKPEQSEEEWKEFSEATQIKVIKFMSKWIAECFKEFTPSLLVSIQNFIVSLADAPPLFSKLLSEALSTKIHPIPAGETETPPSPIIPQGLSLILTIVDIDNLELARQLTIIEFGSFSSIKDRELMNGAWAKAFGEHRAPHVTEMRARERDIRKWIISTIVREHGVKERAALVNKFVEIAEHMLEMNNFNGFCTIMSSINSITITRLHHTFEALPKESFDLYRKLSTIASETHGHKAIRDLEAKAEPPGILLMEPILVELIFIEDSQNDYDGKLIRFGKRRMIYDVIHPILKFQNTPYNFTPIPRVASMLQNWNKLLTDREQYEMSLQREP